MNTTIISGRLVRNPGYNEVENEKGLHKIAKFVLAVRRNYSDEVSFIPVKAFAKKAEFARDYLMQGTKVMVEGEIVTGNYEDKDTGKKIYTTELVKIGKLVRIVPNNGKANHFYINDIYENEMEEESMMTLDRIMANMPMEEREIIMDKMVAASRDILETIADMGYLDEYETPLTPMEERGYYDEEGNLDIDAVEADGYEFGMDLAFGVLSVCEGKPERVLEIQQYVNEQYECCSNKKFMKVLETIARMNGNEEVYIEDMYACNKEARNYYLSELMMCFNFVFNEMCHGTGSAANCDFDVEE